MSTGRKKHAHPPLAIPADNEPVEHRGRIYTYHATKGWRSRNAAIVFAWMDKQRGLARN